MLGYARVQAGLQKVERALMTSGDNLVRIALLRASKGEAYGCTAPPELSREEHAAWHAAKDERVFSLDLGAAPEMQRRNVNE